MQNFNQFPNYNHYTQTNTYAIVNGFEGAKNYPIGINQSILLMDSSNPIVYKKSTNVLGQYSIECFKLVQINPQEFVTNNDTVSPPKDYVSKTEFEELVKKLDALTKKVGEENA